MQNKLCLQFDTIPYIIYFTVEGFPQKKKVVEQFRSTFLLPSIIVPYKCMFRKM